MKITNAEIKWACLLCEKVGRGMDDMDEIRKKAARFRRISREHVSCMIVDVFLQGDCTVNDVIGICAHWVEPRLLRRRLKYQQDKEKKNEEK